LFDAINYLKKAFSDVSFCFTGIVSYGFGCGKIGYPGLYTNVYYFLEWIKEKTYDMTIRRSGLKKEVLKESERNLVL
jgi:secreted trypsin-like serine protease